MKKLFSESGSMSSPAIRIKATLAEVSLYPIGTIWEIEMFEMPFFRLIVSVEFYMMGKPKIGKQINESDRM
jgi:hypothetical protein